MGVCYLVGIYVYIYNIRPCQLPHTGDQCCSSVVPVEIRSRDAVSTNASTGRDGDSARDYLICWKYRREGLL